MNQNNGKNSLGLDKCFEEANNPIELFKKWFAKAEETEINDPNAVAVATVDKNNQPSVRIVLLKGLSDKGFVFYTNFNSKKGNDLKINKKSSMCFHWKSLRRQVRILFNTYYTFHFIYPGPIVKPEGDKNEQRRGETRERQPEGLHELRGGFPCRHVGNHVQQYQQTRQLLVRHCRSSTFHSVSMNISDVLSTF